MIYVQWKQIGYHKIALRLGRFYKGFLGDEEIIPQFLCDILKTEFQLPDSLEPINILVLGYADTNREEALSTERYNKMRKELSETVSFESL